MASNSAKTRVLSLYKMLMRESQKFTNYNFRNYALRRVRDGFQANKSLSEAKDVKKEIEFAKANLDIIRRQAVIGNMFKTEKLVIERKN